MGKVYLARDERAGREVALKLLTGAGAASRRRFQREGELAGRLQHPGIVQVHTAGEHGPYRYLVCELVPGARPLDQAWSAAGLRQRVAWIREAALALGHAHQLGIVHRDVKPANLLVDGQGALRVADFGVAAAADLERLTQTGAAVGTPTHMSPEQLNGAQATPAADVWGLGVVLYQALTDQLPFVGHTWMQLVEAIQQGPTPPASSGGSEVPRRLEQICMQALAPDPERRLPDGGALADELEGWLEGRSSHKRRWAPALVGAAALLISLALGARALARRPSVAPEASPSASPRSLTGQELYLRARALASDQPQAAFSLFLAAAEQGLPEAQEQVAQRLYSGAGIEPDGARALDWWRRAAEGGSWRAAMNLGVALRRGEGGVERDEQEALRWLRQAALEGEPVARARLGLALIRSPDRVQRVEGSALLQQAAEEGSPLAMTAWGELLLAGALVHKDVAQSARWFQRAAEGGDVSGMSFLAQAYDRGWGVPADPAKALVWWGRAAEGGDPKSMTHVAAALLKKGPSRDERAAERWLRRAIAAGDSEALLVFASSFSESEEQTTDLFRRAAEAGHEQAMRGYAKRLAEGKGVPQDAAAAERWFARSTQWYLRRAEGGSDDAMFEVGKAYLEGRGVPTSVEQGLRWLEEAAKRGHVSAMYQLGLFLMTTSRDRRDPPRAARWLKRAAEEGDARAMTSYGVACWSGQGVARDRAAALSWFRRGAESGSMMGAVKLALALEQEQPAEAERLLRRAAKSGFLRGTRELARFLIDRGEPESRREGLDWLRRAEEQGDQEAANVLGVYHARGEAGLPQDFTEAARHFRVAAQGGHANGAYSLGYLYATGQGVPRSKAQAALWLRRALELARASGEPRLEAAARQRLAELE